MSNAAEALKRAIENEKSALENYREAIPNIQQKETREAVEKIVSERDQWVESLTWMLMAEANPTETQASSEPAQAETEAKPASKCPFSGALAEMGIDISKMGDMPEAEIAKMKDMMKDMTGEHPDS